MSSAGLFLAVFLIGAALQGYWIGFLKKRKVIQNLKLYGPQNHLRDKKNIPTMGGAVFLFLALLSGLTLVFWGRWSCQKALLFLGFPLTGGSIGLADDLIKFFRGSSEGLRSLQKLALQVISAVAWSFFLMPGGVLTLAPGRVLEGIPGALVLLFFLVGTLNAANITDGLDGLLSGVMVISFTALLLFIREGDPGRFAALLGLGLSAGFLIFNFHPARVFMGDCGSHFLGGLLVSICAAKGMLLLILPLGFIMGVEVISVIIQIIAIRGFGRRVFSMSPVHHHFEMEGWGERTVVLSFWFFHLVGMGLLLILYKYLPLWTGGY